MGSALSVLGDQAPPPKLVLVPPMFQRNLKARSRFARSSYDYLFAKPQLKWLLHDFMNAPGLLGVLYFSPAADPRVSVKAKVGTIDGSMALRLQPLGAEHPYTFVDLNANPKDPSDIAVRACYFDLASGMGAFATIPLARQLSGDKSQVGIRYSTPELSTGAVVSPDDQHLSRLWLAARFSGLTVGAQSQLNVPLSTLVGPVSAYTASGTPISDWLLARTSYAMSYSPAFTSPTSQGNFTASAEVHEGHTLLLSFFQHMAVSRRTVNPFEDDKVVGITNYINIGVQLVTPISGRTSAKAPQPAAGGNGGDGASAVTTATGEVAQAAAVPLGATTYSNGRRGNDDGMLSQLVTPKPGIYIGAEWQVNKNWLVKGRVGMEDAAAAVGFRSWFQPSVALAGCVQYNYAAATPRFGITIQTENFGSRLYEKGAPEAHGRALLQRHEANQSDIANFEGEGPLVFKSATTQDYNVTAPAGSHIL